MVDGLDYAVDGHTGYLTFARPEKHNAISHRMWSAIPDAVAEVESDTNVVALVLTGAGDNFSAGADIGEFTNLRSNASGAALYDKAVLAAVDALSSMRKPSIAMIRGNCIGGGCQLSVACDFRFAADGAKFGITPSKLGIVYDFESTRQLVSLIGPSRARHLLLTGDILSSEQALDYGLVDRVVTEDALSQVTASFVQTVASRSQFAVRGMNQIIGKIARGQTAPDAEVDQLRQAAVEGVDYAEGVAAFLERRKPDFPYR